MPKEEGRCYCGEPGVVNIKGIRMCLKDADHAARFCSAVGQGRRKSEKTRREEQRHLEISQLPSPGLNLEVARVAREYSALRENEHSFPVTREIL